VTSLWDQANPQLRNLTVYEPGKPIEETALELHVDPGQIIKLASNENPLGPSPKAIKAIRCALQSAQLYPDFGARTVETATPNFHQDLDAMVDAITPKTKIIFIANPNNPTGALISQERIDNFISRVPENMIAVFDEAYFEFLDNPPDTLCHVRQGKNVVVLRTFSKIHGLASLRIGYGIARRELIEVLQKTRQPFNVNGIAQTGALAAIEDTGHQRETKRVVDLGRAYFQEQFREMKLEFVPAAANFVMVNVGDGAAVFKKLLAKKIIVRPIKNYGLPAWLRVTIGTMEQNEKCIAALKDVLEPPPSR
jgi:histidinol-phosphate aminotransferase